MRRVGGRRGGIPTQVSTLIRPEGRMRLDVIDAEEEAMRVSTLIRPEGRMRRLLILGEGVPVGVSTLIRPEGRMRRPILLWTSAQAEFQPSSDPKAGCDLC